MMWVRETWGFTARWPVGFCEEHLRERLPWEPNGMAFRADNPPGLWCWKSPIHLLRQWSRINRKILSVRPERLQDITEDDARGEGCFPIVHSDGAVDCGTRKSTFATLWDSINGKNHPWASNPWVWRIEFEK